MVESNSRAARQRGERLGPELDHGRKCHVARNGVLSGYRVIDMCHGLAGPSATRILASLGADVIKIEMPGTGEFTRQVVPYVFRSHHRDKRSLAVDLKSPMGFEVVSRLAATSNVF